jgi:excisionase family DNA binding protein
MPDDIESAFRTLLRTVVREVAVELSNNQRVQSNARPQQQRSSDDNFLLRSRDAAKRLAISESHLSTLTRSGVLPCVRVGQCVRYRVETIQQWIRDSEAGLVPTPQAESTTKKQNKQKSDSESVTPSPKSVQKKTARRVQTNTGKQKGDGKSGEVVRSRSEQDAAKAEQHERSSPFDLLLREIGVNRKDVPALTNGDLMRIAEVDIATFHGWMYLNRELPEAALEKLRCHFRNWRAS